MDICRITIELDLSDPAQKMIWEHWVSLTRKGEASQWVRDVLQKGLPLLNINSPLKRMYENAKFESINVLSPKKVYASKQLRVTDEPTYEEIDE